MESIPPIWMLVNPKTIEYNYYCYLYNEIMDMVDDSQLSSIILFIIQKDKEKGHSRKAGVATVTILRTSIIL